jgi:hypothetical protein
MIALLHERLALAMADQTTLRLLEPPMALQPIHHLMLWPAATTLTPVIAGCGIRSWPSSPSGRSPPIRCPVRAPSLDPQQLLGGVA